MKIYTYDDALASSLEYFNGDDLAARVFLDKYALRNLDNELLELTPKDMHNRLSSEFARVEKKKYGKDALTKEEIFGYFDGFKYINCQGSPMFGIGNNYTYQSLGNCFTLGENPYDSYGGIMYADQMLAQLFKRRAGGGICLDKIRPKGGIVKNAAKNTDGIGIFMERFSNTTREVAIQNRRGALLEGLSVHHPEIDTFINIKRDLKKVTGSNISVLITNEFMEALKEDKDYELRWPIDQEVPEMSEMTSAKKVWDNIIDSAWDNSEPGIMYIDHARKYGLSHQYGVKDVRFKDVVSNPCQPGCAKILTPTGIKELKDIQINDTIWSKEGWCKVINKCSSGVKQVNKYVTTSGVFYGTKEHKLVVDKTGLQEQAEKAESIEIITGPQLDDNDKIIHNPNIIMDGLVMGDGSIHKASNNLVGLYIGQYDKDYFTSEIKDLITKYRPGVAENFYTVKTTVTHNEIPHTYNREIPKRFLYGNHQTVISFLRGLYSANGSVCANRVTLKSSSKCIIEDVQCMLSSIGIHSYYTTNNPTTVEFSNGNYLCKQSYDLNISTDRDKFVKHIGFIQQYKNDKIDTNKSRSRTKTTYDIISVEDFSNEEVFNITVNNTSHTYWTQGCNVSNCGEVIMGFGSCRLMLLNLFSYVDNPFTKQASFNYKLFAKHSEIAQRLMDDLVDLEIEKMNKIISKVKNDPEPEHIKRVEIDMWTSYREVAELGRRTGLGITALGDTLAALNIRYGSQKSIETTDEVYKQLAIHSMISSCEMARDLGAFPVYDQILEKDHPFLTRLFKESSKLKSLHSKYGRRNISLTTTAPAGSVSILTQTTSGIEPVFMLEYKRRRKVHKDSKNAKIDFTDEMGDSWEEYTVKHHRLKQWMDVTGKTDITKSPYHNATSESIDWEKSVDIQAVAQQWVTHSISKTCNVPKDISKELISKIYMRAYDKGLKGFTIYREGSRAGVLVSNKRDRRPKTLPCNVYHVSVKGKKYFVLVGLLDGSPYEIFAGINGFLNDSIKQGTIIRKKKSVYKAIFDDKDETELAPIMNSASDEEVTITRLVSLSLRNNVPINDIVTQLENVSGDFYSFSKAIVKALKRHIKDGTKIDDHCPECNTQLTRKEGCRDCLSCGFSKCG